MKSLPVICGIDIGSWTFKICAFDGQKFEVLVNEANFRETPSLVAFTQHQRLIGEEALIKIKSNFKNTIRAPLRLIGLELYFSLIQEELQNATIEYEIGDQLTFFVQRQQKKHKLVPEQLVIGLMAKIKQIVESHNYNILFTYIAIPSYLSHFERKIIKKCAEVAQLGKQINLVDDWVALSSQYSYFRVKQLKQSNSRNILFIDLGYSKMSLFLIQFGVNSAKLLDCEHLRFTGSKNMDLALATFYDNEFKKFRKDDKSIFSVPKSYIKLMEAIEKQRKVLSANIDHHLSIEFLLNDEDLNFKMTRSQFEDIILPTICEIAGSMKRLKERNYNINAIHGIQIIGGSTRIPNIQSIITNIFQIEPSKTLNQTQAMARGIAIFGALQKNFIQVDYNIFNRNLLNIMAGWNQIEGEKFFGEDEQMYKHKKILFEAGQRVPTEEAIEFYHEGRIELYIYYDQNISTKSIGYFRIKTPNKITFYLNSSKILHIKQAYYNFDVFNFHQKKQSKWEMMKKIERQTQQIEQRIKRIQELKNTYQSRLYAFKNKLSEFEIFADSQQIKYLLAKISQAQRWIESENNRHLGTDEDILVYKQRLDTFHSYNLTLDSVKELKLKTDTMIKRYNHFKRQLLDAEKQKLSQRQKRKLTLLMQWGEQSYSKMKEIGWQGYYFTINSLQDATQQIKRILLNP